MSKNIDLDTLKGMLRLMAKKDGTVSRAKELLNDMGCYKLLEVPEDRYSEVALAVVRACPEAAWVWAGMDWEDLL
jgi:hypothetical protein